MIEINYYITPYDFFCYFLTTYFYSLYQQCRNPTTLSHNPTIDEDFGYFCILAHNL